MPLRKSCASQFKIYSDSFQFEIANHSSFTSDSKMIHLYNLIGWTRSSNFRSKFVLNNYFYAYASKRIIIVLLHHCISLHHCNLHHIGSQTFSRKHPIALWASSMLVIFAGGILANLLLGEPVLAPLKNNNQLLLSTAVWSVWQLIYRAGRAL